MRGLLLNYQYGMWDAVLQKTKTNTRRTGAGLDEINKNPDDYAFKGIHTSPATKTMYAEMQQISTGKIKNVIIRNKPGDYAYLQEPLLKTKENVFYKYRDANGHCEEDHFAPLIKKAIEGGASWQNKYFMPAEFARFYVKFTRFNIVRLEEISLEDCLAEGIQKQGDSFYYYKDGVKVFFTDVKKAYFSLYNSVNNIKENNNPWMISYHFELCQNPEKHEHTHTRR